MPKAARKQAHPGHRPRSRSQSVLSSQCPPAERSRPKRIIASTTIWMAFQFGRKSSRASRWSKHATSLHDVSADLSFPCRRVLFFGRTMTHGGHPVQSRGRSKSCRMMPRSPCCVATSECVEQWTQPVAYGPSGYPELQLPGPSEPVEIRYCGFHWVIMRREVLEAVGDHPFNLSEGNGLMPEDYSFCERVSNAKLRIFCATDLFVAHVEATDGAAYLPRLGQLRMRDFWLDLSAHTNILTPLAHSQLRRRRR